MENMNKQTPATLNQIESTSPNVPRSFNRLEGDIAGTLNAGHYKTIALKECMASERIAIEGAQLFIQMMTPRTPAYQRLKAVVKCFFVPHSRVWKNYYKFKAQNGGLTDTRPQIMPNLEGKLIPKISINQSNQKISVQESTFWRDCWASSYIPRVGIGQQMNETDNIEAPPINSLTLRGWVAIWNDGIRNKEYDEPRIEYDGDTVSDNEFNSYFWTSSADADYYTARARRNNSYYTNYRTSITGYEAPAPNVEEFENWGEYAMNWTNWEASFNEQRKQSELAQANPWDVSQKLSGGKKLTEGRVQLVATREFPINYSAITQNAYNNNDQIEEKYRVMGMQGAFSYTEIDLGFLNGLEIVEDGYMHVLLCITADTVFESGIERQFMNNRWDERFRPDLIDQKLDVMYESEYGTPWANPTITDYKTAIGYKRKWTEMFKLPNILNGEVYNRGYYQAYPNGSVRLEENRIIPNDTYQFFEYSGTKLQNPLNLEGIDKHIWKDYTDILVNKNLAVMQSVYTGGTADEMYWQGPNQIVYFGKHYCLTDMPIPEEIKTNYTKWGEH